MYFILNGNKAEMNKCKKAFLTADGDFDISVESLSMKRIGILNKYELKVELVGDKSSLKRFNKRVSANYDILNGNILGMLDYI